MKRHSSCVNFNKKVAFSSFMISINKLTELRENYHEEVGISEGRQKVSKPRTESLY